ncbi:MAG: fluoride efflux transporter CrcB [Nakamurella sp.]
MTLLSWCALILAGGLGAATRYLVDRVVTRHFGSRWAGALRVGVNLPYGTLVVNVSGALALGFVVSAALPGAWAPIVGTGFLGAYTTFSTWMLQTYELAVGREMGHAAANIVIPAAVGLAAAAGGFWLGTLV